MRIRKIRSPISDSQNSQLLFRFVTFFNDDNDCEEILCKKKKKKNPQFFHSWA